MTTPVLRNINVYCKICYTDITKEYSVQENITISDFLEFANTTIKPSLNINDSYDIDIVNVGNLVNGDAELAPPIEPRYDQTLGERYRDIINSYKTISFYVRPVHPITREFIRRENYSIQPNTYSS